MQFIITLVTASLYSSLAAASLSAVKRLAAATTTTLGPLVPPTASGYVYALCAVEPFYNGIQARTLHGSSQISSSLTVEKCASYCSSFKYFGVEYSSECYCGNTLQNGTTQDLLGGCNNLCAGNSSEYCGGSGRMNFYQTSTLSAALSLPTSYSVATIPSVNVTGYKYLTCVVEPFMRGINARALSAANTASSAMTVEMCASYCAGYTYFGVEYSQGTSANPLSIH